MNLIGISGPESDRPRLDLRNEEEVTLSSAYCEANWELFAELFTDLYTTGDDLAKLELTRALLCEYKDEGALKGCLKVLL